MASIAERIVAELKQDDTGINKGPFGQCSEEPPITPGEYLTDFELNLRDWGLIYGMAYAMARGEDAFEPRTAVAARALEQARQVFGVLNDNWSGRGGFHGDRRWRPVPARWKSSRRLCRQSPKSRASSGKRIGFCTSLEP